jgi:hypothetical protein
MYYKFIHIHAREKCDIEKFQILLLNNVIINKEKPLTPVKLFKYLFLESLPTE